MTDATVPVDPKHWLTSKTILFNLVAAVLFGIQGNTEFLFPPEYQVMAVTIINILLRAITKQPVAWSVPKAPMIFLGALFLSVAPAFASDLQWATLRLATTEGAGVQVANGTTSTGAVLLLHTELLNYGDTINAMDPVSGKLTTERDRKFAVDYCLGGGAQGGGTDVNNLTAPMGICFVGYDLASLGLHYDFSNRAGMATLSVNLLNLPSTMKPVVNLIVDAIAGNKEPAPTP